MSSVAMMRSDGIPDEGVGFGHRLGVLYSEHATSLLRLAYVMTGDSQTAEDVVQEAFVRLYARFKDRGTSESLDHYLRKIVINLCRDHHRRKATERRHLDSDAASNQAIDKSFESVDSSLAFQAALQGLPHRQRAAIALRYLDDLSERQAADILGCSVGAIKQLVSRGIRALRLDTGERHSDG